SSSRIACQNALLLFRACYSLPLGCGSIGSWAAAGSRNGSARETCIVGRLLTFVASGLAGSRASWPLALHPRCHITPPERSLTGGRPGRSDDDVPALQDPRNEAPRP